MISLSSFCVGAGKWLMFQKYYYVYVACSDVGFNTEDVL